MYVDGIEGTAKGNYDIDVSIIQTANDSLIAKAAADTGLESSDFNALTGVMDFSVTIKDEDNFGKIVSMSWILPAGTENPKYYKKDVISGEYSEFWKPNIDFQSSNYISDQVFYNSKDGTKIPMIITYKKGTVLDGNNPTILYGYGGFNISQTPRFSITNAAWLELGGIYAVPNIRGGGEYGRNWHNAGIKTNKQNVFDDFIAAAEYLIKENYTSNNYLAIRGGSNGGLLVGACLLYTSPSPRDS